MTNPAPFLRDTPSRESYLSRAETEIAARATVGDEAKAKALGRLGDVYRSHRRAQDARDVLMAALALECSEETRRANRLRLATAQFYGGAHDVAETSLRALREETRGGGPEMLEDYVVQHLGKCLAERGELAAAEACFEEALALRRAFGRGDDLIASSERAQREAQRRRQGQARRAQGEPGEGIDLEWLRRWHDANAGATRSAFLGGRDSAGRSSYQRLLEGVERDDTVLDVGCGDGTLLELIARQREKDVMFGAKPSDEERRARQLDEGGLLGVEPSDGERRAAEARLEGTGARVLDGRAQALPFETGSIDVVLCHMALMLFGELEVVLGEVARVLREGGRLAAVVGGGEAPPSAWSMLREKLWTCDFIDDVRLIDARAMKGKEIERMLHDAGMRDVTVESFTLAFDATPADVWAHFMSSYDPARMRPEDIEALADAFFRDVVAQTHAGRVPFVLGMQTLRARRHQ